jgi:hypothetical protein
MTTLAQSHATGAKSQAGEGMPENVGGRDQFVGLEEMMGPDTKNVVMVMKKVDGDENRVDGDEMTMDGNMEKVGCQ